MSTSPRQQRHAYNSRLSQWESVASVRIRPRRRLTAEEQAGQLYFSAPLVPVVDHPLFKRLGPTAQRDLLILHLYHYLDFTANFEVQVVNRTAQAIAAGN